MRKYRIAEGLVVKCAKQRRLKELAFFYEMKYIFSSGCIHNYNHNSFRNKLAEKEIKYSYSKIRRHFDQFIKWGWCFLKDGNLYFKANRFIHSRSKDIKIRCWVYELLPMLKAILIDRKKRQCLFAYKWRLCDKSSKVRNYATMKGSAYQKLQNSLLKIAKRSRAHTPHFKIGSTALGGVLGCGRTMACNNVKRLKGLGLLHVRDNQAKVIKKGITAKQSWIIRNRRKYSATMFFKNGCLMQHEPREYNIPFFVFRKRFRIAANFSQSTSTKK